MKIRFSLAAAVLLAASGATAPFVSASDSVVVNGMTVNCSTRCVVTTSGGTTTVRDCCGGRIWGTLQQQEEIAE